MILVAINSIIYKIHSFTADLTLLLKQHTYAMFENIILQ